MMLLRLSRHWYGTGTLVLMLLIAYSHSANAKEPAISLSRLKSLVSKKPVEMAKPTRPTNAEVERSTSGTRRAVHETSSRKPDITLTTASTQYAAASEPDGNALPSSTRWPKTVDPSSSADDAGSVMALDALVAVGLQQNPRLAKVSFAVEAARGRAYQAGLYPNPLVALTWDELGDKTGRSGVNTLPLVTQEIVMGRKLQLSRAAAEREIEQASWGVMAERYAMLAEIRSAYFDVLGLQERVRMLGEIRRYGFDAAETVRSLRDDAKTLADIDVLPVEAELARYEADFESAQAEKAAAYKRLAALLGLHQLSITKVAGRFEDYSFPDYNADATPLYVLSVHPEIQTAQWGVEKANLLVQRAKAEPIPNLSVNGGYVRQNQNRSDDYTVGVSASIPLYNRNQGNIRAAEAELCAAMQEVGRLENDLTDRVASAVREFAAARKRAERYQVVVAKAEQAQNIATEDQRKNLSPLMVLELQRSVRQARLERLKALGDAWKAAAKISGMTIEDDWPPAPRNTGIVPPAPAVEAAKS